MKAVQTPFKVNLSVLGERVYPGTQYDGITDDEMSAQINETDDSLQNSVNLSTLDTSSDTNQQSGRN